MDANRGETKLIQVFHRAKKMFFTEHVLAQSAMQLFYGSTWGRFIIDKMLTSPWVSRLVGYYNDSHLSKDGIKDFAKTLNIDLGECEKSVEEYKSFNDFFARTLKPGSRVVDARPEVLVSPGDGRLLILPGIQKEMITPVKWAPVSIFELLGSDVTLSKEFEGGTCAVLRLCPADYHRFHFPVTGEVGDTKLIKGQLHSVSPIALEQSIPVFCLNKRTLCTINSNEFDKVLFMEVGAMFVGGIVQTYHSGLVSKGMEKGYFKFGGSTILLLFKKNTVRWDEDIIEKSSKGIETLVSMGERIGVSANR